jgi:hypothetical protein
MEAPAPVADVSRVEALVSKAMEAGVRYYSLEAADPFVNRISEVCLLRPKSV